MADENNVEAAGGTRVERPVVSHGSAFAGNTTRATGLAGGLGGRSPRRTPPPVPPAVPDDQSHELSQPTGESKDAPASVKRRASGNRPKRAATKSSPTGKVPPTTARLPEKLKVRLTDYSVERRTDYARVLLEAFEAQHHRIPELFDDQAEDRVALGLPPISSLFAPRPVQVNDTRGVGTVQVNFSLTENEREVIEGLVERHQMVPDRNALIVRVLKAHLDVVAPEEPELAVAAGTESQPAVENSEQTG